MRATTRTTDALFDDILTETAALDLLHEKLGARPIPEPRWRTFDDREAHEAQLFLDLAAAGVSDGDW